MFRAGVDPSMGPAGKPSKVCTPRHMTTAHHDEPLDEALWFAFYCAKDADFKPEWSVVVIVVDSESLETRCRDWLETNRE